MTTLTGINASRDKNTGIYRVQGLLTIGSDHIPVIGFSFKSEGMAAAKMLKSASMIERS